MIVSSRNRSLLQGKDEVGCLATYRAKLRFYEVLSWLS
jgi:hypothetical protein